VVRISNRLEEYHGQSVVISVPFTPVGLGG
jgi:hypothetical protein